MFHSRSSLRNTVYSFFRLQFRLLWLAERDALKNTTIFDVRESTKTGIDDAVVQGKGSKTGTADTRAARGRTQRGGARTDPAPTGTARGEDFLGRRAVFSGSFLPC